MMSYLRITPTATSQAAFLSNSHNKNRLIEAVREKMLMFGIRVKQAEADADTLIISTALHVAESAEVPVVVIGTDRHRLTGHASGAGNPGYKCVHVMPQQPDNTIQHP